MKKIVTALLTLFALQLMTISYVYANYDTNDVNVINSIIENNGLIAEENKPESWDFVTWNGENPNRIVVLSLNNKSLVNSLDVSGLSSLQELDCINNNITGLNVSGLSALQTLQCHDNPLTSLKLSDGNSYKINNGENSNIRLNGYDFQEKLVTLQSTPNEGYSFRHWLLDNGEKIEDNPYQFFVFHNIEITPVLYQMSENDVAVINAIIENNGLSAEKNKPETWNFVTWGDEIPNRIVGLNLSRARLENSLDVSGLSSLKELGCVENRLTEINASGLSSLQRLACNYNILTKLNVSGASSLQELNCSDNRLTEINLSGLSSLQELKCVSNGLTEINVSELSSLQTLECDNNPLTSLKLTDQYSYNINNAENNRIYLVKFDFAQRKVKLLSTPDSDSLLFSHWLNNNGDKVEDNPYEFTINSNIELTPVLKNPPIKVSPNAKKAAASDITFSIEGDLKNYQYAVKIPNKRLTWKRFSKPTVSGVSTKAGYEIQVSEYKKPETVLETYTVKQADISPPRAPSASVKSTASGVAGTTNLTFAKKYDKLQFQLDIIDGALEDEYWWNCPVETDGSKYIEKDFPTNAGRYVFIRQIEDEYYPASQARKSVKVIYSGEAPVVDVSFSQGAKGADITFKPGEGVNIKTLQYAVVDKDASTDDLLNTKIAKWKSVSRAEVKNVKIENEQAVFVRTKATSNAGFSAARRFVFEVN